MNVTIQRVGKGIWEDSSRKIAGSNPNEAIGCYIFPNSSSRTMALGSTQPLTEMSTSNIPGGGGGGKGGPRVRLTTSPAFVSRLSRENMGASTSYNTVGLHGLLQE
jgi:hypothetical protein